MAPLPNRYEHSIIAQCTPHGSGALALIRLSGSNAIEIADKFAHTQSGKSLRDAKTHTIHYGWVVAPDGTHIDQVLFLLMHAPRTFTGQDTIEITCHNNPFIIEQIISLAIKFGARMATAGEFTQRAVTNEKIDLLQAEAINELIHANTQIGLKQSLAQLEGSFSSWFVSIEKQLIKALALSEASFEFIDEEHLEFSAQIKKSLEDVQTTIKKLQTQFDQQKQIREGVRIAIIGSVNAGKSSLFNALLGSNRAIVTPIAGTTRDVIEAGLYKNGTYWTLIDTAGLRETDDEIEQQGIERSFREAESADIILLVVDTARELSAQETEIYRELLAQHGNKIIMIASKSDLPAKNNFAQNSLNISSTAKIGLQEVEQKIQEKIDALFTHVDSPFLLNKRQFNILASANEKLRTILPLLDDPEFEIISYHLNDLLSDLSQLTGKSISEAGMDAVFREFCVGK
jgi:tRNA modification GTPase